MLASSVKRIVRQWRTSPPPSAQTGAEMAIKLGSTPAWMKSSRSTGNGACVEVKSPAVESVVVRDSKDPQGPVLTFSPEAWSAFVDGVENGAFTIN
jgi:hypothetical protein